MNFRELGLNAPILRALTQAGYTEPTPIQQQAIPPALAGRDVLGCAQTGTGKTCAFAAPILQRLDGAHPRPRVIRALILTPTRELAIQIQDSFTAYGRNLSLKSAVIFGGVGQQPQVDAIRAGLDILVATPGRLLDLQGQNLLDLSRIEIFVLDEADRMLDMGFIHDVRRVLKLLPGKKQTMLFSATMPPEVMGLVNGLLRNYVRVEVDPVSSPVEAIEQSLYYVDRANKTKLLAHLMNERHIPSALVFSRTKHGANRIAEDLLKRGISAAAIHGNKSQSARVQALSDFKAGRIRVLVATDIAARGIDIEDLPCVFNYNLPDVPETYVHRIGRTGRAGKGGIAISFCQFDEKEELRGVEKLLGRPIPVVEGHPFPMENFDPPVKDKHGRPVNAEDAEARAAAKKRRRERDAEAQARAKEREQAAPVAEEAPAPKERRRRAESGGQTAPESAGAAARRIPEAKIDAPRPAEPGEDARLSGLRLDPSLSAGARRGRLEDTLPAEPSMPAADFYKPNPLDSDVVMDATARLLASRRPLPGDSRSGSRRERGDRAAPRSAREERRQSARDRQREERRQAGQTKARQERKSAPAGPEERQTGQPGQGRQPGEPPGQDRPASGKKRRRRSRRTGGETRPAGGQRDSTQQESLMKPYYLSDDRE